MPKEDSFLIVVNRFSSLVVGRSPRERGIRPSYPYFVGRVTPVALRIGTLGAAFQTSGVWVSLLGVVDPVIMSMDEIAIKCGL